MSGDSPYVPLLPEHPELREIALVIEGTGMMGELFDERFRSVFIASETVREYEWGEGSTALLESRLSSVV